MSYYRFIIKEQIKTETNVGLGLNVFKIAVMIGFHHFIINRELKVFLEHYTVV